MADVTDVRFTYPPNFTGTYKTTYPKRKEGHRRVVVLCTNDSDGTGEDDVIKVKRTDMLTTNGDTPTKLVIEKIDYSILGMHVEVGYNNPNEERVAILPPGDGCMDFRDTGGFTPEDDTEDSGGGDIVFTTIDASSGYSYTIELTVRPK